MRLHAAALVLVLLAATSAVADIADQLDQPARDLVCTKWWNGTAPKMARLKGRVVVVHFSDPKKITSKAFISSVRKLWKANKDKPFTLIEIVLGTSEAWARQYVNENEVDWLVGFDGAGAAEAAYPGSSVPRTYVIGPAGRIQWHAHIGALTKDALQSQLVRVSFFDTKSVPRKARPAAKAASELKFSTAIDEANKLIENKYTNEEEKAIGRTILEEAKRYFDFQWKLMKKERQEMDYGAAWKRAARLEKRFKRTEHHARIADWFAWLQSDATAVYVHSAQLKLDEILKKAGSNNPRVIETLISALGQLQKEFPNNKVTEKAAEWVKTLKKRLERLRDN